MIFSQEHRELQETVRKFVETEVNPHTAEWEKAGIFPAHDLFKKMGDLGLLGINKPEQFGGLGLDYSYQMAFCEALGHSNDGGIAMATTVQTDMATPALSRFGTDELRAEFLTPAITGEMVSSIAVSEPQAGSDVAATRTTAKHDGDDYVINGTKMWITNSTQADFLCLLAITGDGPAHRNKSLIVVPTKLPGISFSDRIDKIGMRSSDTAQVFFDNVRVPQRYRIGNESEGFTMQMIQFQEERLSAAAWSITALENCIKSTQAYCQDRLVFGKPLADNQVIQFRLAELQTEIELLRSLIYRATEVYLTGEDTTYLASMAKLKVGRLSREVTDACLQYWGGMGFTWENPVSHFFRDLRLQSIGGGADEVMLQVIAKKMGMSPN